MLKGRSLIIYKRKPVLLPARVFINNLGAGEKSCVRWKRYILFKSELLPGEI